MSSSSKSGHYFLHNRQHVVDSTTNDAVQSFYMHSESLAEEALIEQLKTLVYEFMARPNRHYSYNTNIHWEINHCNKIKYTVVISID
jgi:hypothetical protein